MLQMTNNYEELINKALRASEAYYNGMPVMTDYDYDKLVSKIEEIEKDTGFVAKNSPTANVGASTNGLLDAWEDVTHEYPALSLDKTKDIYAFKTNSRKSVFSPMINDGADNERSKIIQEQMKDLESVKETLTLKLRSMEMQLNKLRQYLEALNDASDALTSFEPKYETDDPDHTDDYGFTFLEEENEPEDISSHGYDILMLDAFDRALIQTMLEKNVKSGLESLGNKLDMISYLLGTDIGRAKLTVQEILHSTKQIMHSVDTIEQKLTGSTDTSKPIKEQVESYLNDFKQSNPSIHIQASIEMPNPDVTYPPVFNINFVKLIQIFFDNISVHAEATEVIFQASLTPNTIDVVIKDNGKGLPDDYMTDSPWYSSLHKAKETIYMLKGKLDFADNIPSGTSVKFSFPIQQ